VSEMNNPAIPFTPEIKGIVHNAMVVVSARGFGQHDSLREYRTFCDGRIEIRWSQWYNRGLFIYVHGADLEPQLVLRYPHGNDGKIIECFRPGKWVDHLNALARTILLELVQDAQAKTAKEEEQAKLAFEPIDDRAVFEAEKVA